MSIEFVEKKRWLFLGLPFTFTKYVIKEDMITVDTGVFTKVENDCYMYKVQDVEHTASIWERMAGLGTIVCYTGDTTHPKLLIEHIRNSKAIKEFILKESEEARLKRRTSDHRTDPVHPCQQDGSPDPVGHDYRSYAGRGNR